MRTIFTAVLGLALALTFSCSSDNDDDTLPSSSSNATIDPNDLGSCRDSEGGCMSFVTQDFCKEWFNGTFSLNDYCDDVEQCVDTQLFCHNTDGEDGCDPIPSYVTESECVSIPGASVKNREWCITNYKMYWCD